MSEDVKKKAIEMLLSGATLVSEPCPYCKGVRVMKDGDALCISCGKGPDSAIETKKDKSKEETPIKQLEEKLQNMTSALSNERDLKKQQEMLKSINLLIETISKMKE